MALKIQFFGQFQVWRDSTLVSPAEWKMEKNKDLLKILASQPGHLFTKDRLIDLLWPDADLWKASATIRKRISELRYILEPALTRGSASQYILTKREGYAFNPEANYESDTKEFSLLVESARNLERDGNQAEAVGTYEKTVAVYRGTYLEDNPYEEWAIPIRDTWEDRYVDTLSDLAEGHARLGHYRRAIAYCNKILQRKKFRESTYRQLMLYCYAAGFQGEAISAYTKCTQTMSELGVKLAADTKKLYHQILERNIPEIDKDYPAPRVLRQAIPYSLGKIPFVGRDREYSKLVQWLNDLSSDHGRVIMVTGEAGVGKTRLIQEILARYTKEYIVLQSRSQELSIPLAFHPLISALREGITATVLPIRKLEKVQPVWLSELAKLVPELHGVFPKLERNPVLPANQARLRQLESWSQLFLTLIRDAPALDQPGKARNEDTTRPLILFLDDLHWTDSATIDLLVYLLPRLSQHPLVLLGAYRSEEVGKHHPIIELERKARREGVLEHLELDRFSREGVQQLFQKLAPSLTKREALSNHIHHETDGNLFFIVSVLQAFFEEGVIRIEEDKWVTDVDDVTTSYRELLIPDHVRDLIRRRLDRLEASERKLIELLSVWGQPIEYPLLENIWENASEEHDARCMRVLESLLDKHLLLEEKHKYIFSHAKVREVIYQELSRPWRQQWHLCVAEALEATSPADTTEQYAQLAHHYFEAGKEKKSLKYALNGLDRAVPAYRNEEGLSLSTLALKTCDVLEEREHDQAMIESQRFNVLTRRAEIYALQGLREEQSQNITQMEMLAERLKDREKQAIALQKRSELQFRIGKYSEAKRSALKAADLHRVNKTWQGQAACLTTIGNIYRNLGNYKQALQYHQRALQIRKNLAGRQGEAISLGNIGIVFSNLGQHHEALDCLRRSLEITEEINDKRGQAINHGNIGAIYTALGQYKEALSYFKQHLKIAKGIGDRLSQGPCLDNIGIIYSNLGSYENALSHFNQALQIRRETGDRRGQAISLGNLGTLLTVLGKYDDALSYHQQDLAISDEIGDRRGQAVAICNLGIVLLRLSDFKKAVNNFRKSLKIATEIEDKMSQAVDLYNIGNAYSQMEEQGKALRFYEQGRTMFKNLEAKAEYIECLSAEGLAKLEINQLDTALTLSWQAIKLLEAGHIDENPQDAYFAHYRILSAQGEKEKALIYLEQAHKTVMQRARAIENNALRESFLGNVKRNHEIVEAWRSRRDK